MKELDLSGQWMLESTGGISCKGTVPGSVCSFLLGNGLIEDPCFSDNESQVLTLMNDIFTFSRSFDVPKEMRGSARILLRCEGLDTLCEISVNGESVGKADNMHRTWEFDLTGPVKPTRNLLSLRFSSPVKAVREAQAKDPLEGNPRSMPGFSHLRKAAYMFGGDRSPCLPDAGVWRKIALIGEDSSRITDFQLVQRHEGNKCYLTAHICQTGEAKLRLILTTPEGELLPMKEDTETEIVDAQLWWPHGYGEQPLYTLSAELWEDGNCVDQTTRRIGLRTIELSRETDEWGESFCHLINGVRIFAMGASYVPEDSLLSRITPERTRALLENCVKAGFNCIRVWGGGFYPSEEFFDYCDELGLLVWQDFPFTNGVCRFTLPFEETVRAELRDNIRRIRHHACLTLWCGNAGMEQFLSESGRETDCRARADAVKLFEYLIPQLLREEDAVTPYWPSSPSSGGGFDEPVSPLRGDAQVKWDELSRARDVCPRYVSEFGVTSLPSLKEIESFTLPEERNLFSSAMELHQGSEGQIAEIFSSLAEEYLYPGEMELLLYASQLMQAQTMQRQVEYWRRNRGHCLGALYRQVGEVWPGVSGASLEHDGRWKALHYFAKRFYAPVLVSCEASRELRGRASLLSGAVPFGATARLAVTNETRRKRNGTVRWELREADGNIRRSGAFDLELEPLSVKWMEKLEFSGIDLRERYLSFCYEEKGKELSTGTTLFTAVKRFHLKNPQFSYRVEKNRILLRAEAYARSVEITALDCDLLLSDNYFDMNAGTVVIDILEGAPRELQFRSAFDIR